MKGWGTTQVIPNISAKSNKWGCQGREVEFLEEENARHFAQTVNNSQGSLLDNYKPIGLIHHIAKMPRQASILKQWTDKTYLKAEDMCFWVLKSSK